RYIAFCRNSLRLATPQIKEGHIGFEFELAGFEVCIIRPDGEELEFVANGWVVGWTPDSRSVYFIVAEGNHHCLKSIDINDLAAKPKQVMTFLDVEGAISPDGRYIASADSWYTEIREIKTGDVVHRLRAPAGSGWGLRSWSPDGRYLFTSGDGVSQEGLWITDVKTQQSKKVLSGIDAMVAISPDMKHMVLDLWGSYAESWIAELDPTKSLWDQFESIMSTEEHFKGVQEEIAFLVSLYPSDPFFRGGLCMW
ncbi:hypothetical protein ACFL5F_06615, partial [Planctomycetota bacterium]